MVKTYEQVQQTKYAVKAQLRDVAPRSSKNGYLQYRKTLKNPMSVWANSLSFNPDGIHLAVTDNNADTINIWNIDRATIVKKVKKTPTEGVLAHSPDGRYFLSNYKYLARKKMAFIVWDAKTYESRIEVKDYPGLSQVFSFSPDSRSLIMSFPFIGSRKKDNPNLVLYDTETWKIKKTIRGIPYPRTLAFSPDGKYFADGYVDYSEYFEQRKINNWSPAEETAHNNLIHENIRIWDPETLKVVHEIKDAQLGGVTALKFSPDSKYLASGSVSTDKSTYYSIAFDRTYITHNLNEPIKLWNTTTWDLAGQFKGYLSKIQKLYFDNSGDFLIGIDGFSRIHIWSVKKQKKIDEFQIPDSRFDYTMAMNPSRKKLVIGWENEIWVYDVVLPSNKSRGNK